MAISSLDNAFQIIKQILRIKQVNQFLNTGLKVTLKFDHMLLNFIVKELNEFT